MEMLDFTGGINDQTYVQAARERFYGSKNLVEKPKWSVCLNPLYTPQYALIIIC